MMVMMKTMTTLTMMVLIKLNMAEVVKKHCCATLFITKPIEILTNVNCRTTKISPECLFPVDLKMDGGTHFHSSSLLPMDSMLRGVKMGGCSVQARGMPVLMGMGLKMGTGMGIGQGLRNVAVFLILLSLSPILADSRENKGERYLYHIIYLCHCFLCIKSQPSPLLTYLCIS